MADADNDTIRVITPGGVVSTVAGQSGVSGHTNGTGGSALFNNPEGLAIDSAGSLYVADTGNKTIREVTPGGVVTTLAGAPDTTGSVDGLGAVALFSLPTGIAATPSSDFLVADALNNTIRTGLLTPLARISARRRRG